MSLEKWESGDCVLYRGDCLEVLPTLGKVDAVITDPPYGVDGGHGGQLRDYRKADYAGAWEDNPEYIRRVCVTAIHECRQIARTVVLTPGTRCCCAYPQPDEVGCFFAIASSRIGKFGFQTCHPIFYYGWYKARGKGAIATGIVLTETAEDNGHPCPKPINAWTWLVERSTEPNALVLDPFMGSGTTGVACVKLGRKFIGIEIDPGYFEIAKKRILKAQNDAPLFDKPKTRQTTIGVPQ